MLSAAVELDRGDRVSGDATALAWGCSHATLSIQRLTRLHAAWVLGNRPAGPPPRWRLAIFGESRTRGTGSPWKMRSRRDSRAFSRPMDTGLARKMRPNRVSARTQDRPTGRANRAYSR